VAENDVKSVNHLMGYPEMGGVKVLNLKKE
jgi:hypothetical protein